MKGNINMYFKNNKGVTLMALTITIIVMLIITSTIIYNTKSHLRMEKINKLYNDIENINVKIEDYYLKYGEVPTIGNEFCTDKEMLKELLSNNATKNNSTLVTINDNIINKNDDDKYYVIDLEKLDGLTINYGYDGYLAAKNNPDIITINFDNVYIINKTTHQVYYPSGIVSGGFMYYAYSSDNEDILNEQEISSTNGEIYFNNENSINVSEFKIYGNSLPDQYQQVEYIESTGTQYLEIKFVPNQNTRVVVDFQYTTIADTFLFGSRSNISSNGYTLNIGNSKKDAFTGYGNSGNVKYADPDTNRHTVDKNKNELYVDGELKVTLSKNNFRCPGNLEIFAAYNNGTKGYLPSSARIYSFKIYDNSTLKHDLVPCYNISDDDKIGLYDIINNIFYENKGSGIFLKGKDILNEKEIQKTNVGVFVNDKNDINYGKYNIPIRITEKNIFDPNKYFSEYYNSEGGITYTNKNFSTINTIKFLNEKLKPDTQYTFSFDYEITNSDNNGIYLSAIDSSGNTLVSLNTKLANVTGEKRGSISITNPVNTSIAYYKFSYTTSTKTCNVKLTNMQIEEGAQTEYEPYNEKNINIYLDEPLRAVEGHADYIDLNSKKVIRFVKRLRLKNTFNWSNDSYPSITTTLTNKKYFALPGTTVLSNYSESEHFGIIGDDGTTLGFKNSDTQWGFANSEAAKTWLSQNNMYIEYVLKDPIEEELNLTEEIVYNERINIITVDTVIKPTNIKFKYVEFNQ